MNTWKVEFFDKNGWTQNDNILILEGSYNEIVNSFKDENVKISPLHTHKSNDNFLQNHYFEEFNLSKIKEKTITKIEKIFRNKIDKIKKNISDESKKGNTFLEINEFDNHEEYTKITYYFQHLGFTIDIKNENVIIHW